MLRLLGTILFCGLGTIVSVLIALHLYGQPLCG